MVRRVARGLVRVYQICISPLFPPCCRFYPTCSAYAIEAIDRFGFVKGVYLAVTRLARCHPFSHGGVDFVPEKFDWTPWRQRRPDHHEQATT
ncbi:MAG: membrane protein insertion efficiency factor YidD [Pseudomonadales bacterium]|nr:membrane protein insertion efficiency factor YidD [Pseudomonadales bacterium]